MGFARNEASKLLLHRTKTNENRVF